jgi:ABC-2 type transport system ATP-binding protein
VLNIKQLESGTIKVLNDSIKNVIQKVGFMPQEIALVAELSIFETLNYFRNIYGMNSDEFYDRYQMIKKLLELPSDDRRIENLSGGQRRRVSLFVAIIHNPQLLILDEPTVGVDSILRDRIWKFLIDTTKNGVSVIITTHYISEAAQANCCGFMRNGKIMIEDNPQKVMEKFNAETLDEAFLSMCLAEESNRAEFETLQEVENEELIENYEENYEMKARRIFKMQTIKALMAKEFHRIKRQPA